jgi:hypothetical protein
MSTYKLIATKLLNLDKTTFTIQEDDKEVDKVNELHKIFFTVMMNNISSNKSKFTSLNETLNNFYFNVKPHEKCDFLNIFYKIQKIYHTLNKLSYLYKYKKTKITVNNDLQLNEIKLGEDNVICIYHINSRYLFKINELLKLIYTSLTNSYSFFCEPITIKNPYNNIPFSKSILFYIYYFLISHAKIKFINSRYLDIFLKFKDCNFNLTKFVNDYQYLLREYVIINYLNNSSNPILIDQIHRMIDYYNSRFKMNKIDICDNFPQDILIKVMKPYLQLKLISDYSLVHIKKMSAKRKLLKKLYEFQKYNPKFGRKIIKLKDVNSHGKIKKVKSHVEFNTEYKKFYNYEIGNFMNNHLNYKYNPQSDDDDDDEDDEDEDVDDDNNVVEITLDQYSQFIIYSQLLIDTNRNNNSSPLQNPNNTEQDELEQDELDEDELEEQEELEINIERVEQEVRLEQEVEEEEYYFELEDQDSIS